MWTLPKPPRYYLERSAAKYQLLVLLDRLGENLDSYLNGDFKDVPESLYDYATGTLMRFGILPLKENETFRKPEKSVVKTPSRPNLAYPEFEVNVYYNVKNHNPSWWNMVGTGEPYNEVCGHVWPGEYRGCLDTSRHALHGQVGKIVLQKVSANCDRLECPVCYPKVIAKRAKTIERRFLRMPKYSSLVDNRIRQVSLMDKNEAKKVDIYAGVRKEPIKTAEDRTQYGKPIHLMISPSKEDCRELSTQQGYLKQKRRMMRMAQKVGMDGGVIIFHPWRSDKETLPEMDEIGEFKIINGEFDIDFIKEYMKTFGKEFNAWKTSPHWHIIGYAKNGIDGEKVSKNYDKTGWVIKNLGVRKSVLSTAFYQLTHAGIHKGIKTITWFGVMGSTGRSYLDKNGLDEPEPELRTCPICKQKMLNYVYTGDGEIPLENKPEGTYIVDYIHGLREVYKLKADRKIEVSDTVEYIDSIFQYEFMPDKTEKNPMPQENTMLNYF